MTHEDVTPRRKHIGDNFQTEGAQEQGGVPCSFATGSTMRLGSNAPRVRTKDRLLLRKDVVGPAGNHLQFP
jgi:hypothetical protein